MPVGVEREGGVAPRTPPMMRKGAYDADAAEADAREFSDAGFYDDDESTGDDGVGYGSGGVLRR